MIINYQAYLLEKEFKKLNNIFESVNESALDIIDKVRNWVKSFLNKFSLDEIIQRITKMNFFYSLMVLSILISGFNINKSDIISKLEISDISNKSELLSNLELIIVSNDTIRIDTTTRNYLEKIAKKESSGDWTKINQLGYIGKYQFGRIAIEDVGLNTKSLNSKNFKKNPLIWSEKEQDHAMIKLLRNNIKYLGKYLHKYVGKEINGIELTKSGLLAASHLVGAKEVKKYLNSGGKYIPKDGNGTSLEEYIKNFGDFEINI